MGETTYPRRKFSDLTPECAHYVLGLMAESIHMAADSQIKKKTYQTFVQCLRNGTDFSPERVWSSLGDSTTDHYHHSAQAIASIQKHVAALTPKVKADPPEAPPPDEEAIDDRSLAAELYDAR